MNASSAGGALVYNLASLSHLRRIENGRAWVSDPAAARSENVALPFLFAWFALFDAKKVTSRFVPGRLRLSRLRVGGSFTAKETVKKLSSLEKSVGQAG